MRIIKYFKDLTTQLLCNNDYSVQKEVLSV